MCVSCRPHRFASQVLRSVPARTAVPAASLLRWRLRSYSSSYFTTTTCSWPRRTVLVSPMLLCHQMQRRNQASSMLLPPQADVKQQAWRGNCSSLLVRRHGCPLDSAYSMLVRWAAHQMLRTARQLCPGRLRIPLPLAGVRMLRRKRKYRTGGGAVIPHPCSPPVI